MKLPPSPTGDGRVRRTFGDQSTHLTLISDSAESPRSSGRARPLCSQLALHRHPAERSADDRVLITWMADSPGIHRICCAPGAGVLTSLQPPLRTLRRCASRTRARSRAAVWPCRSGGPLQCRTRRRKSNVKELTRGRRTMRLVRVRPDSGRRRWLLARPTSAMRQPSHPPFLRKVEYCQARRADLRLARRGHISDAWMIPSSTHGHVG
jgi:hypothetical protein